MGWRCLICDTATGQVVAPIDIPSLRWTLTVSDCSMSTERDKGTGDADATGLQVPWSAVPATDAYGRSRMLASYRRAISLVWEHGDGTASPVVFGAIGSRSDTWDDTSFDLVSPLTLLGSRVLVREGAFGRGDPAGTTQGDMSYSGLSRRAIACAVGQACTDYKPGGSLPIDWQYQGEAGAHSATYPGHDVANNTCKQIWTSLANSDGGPDIQLRPYMADESHVRLLMCAGSDSDPYLGQTSPVRTLTAFPGGGSVRSLKVAYAAPTMRVYATGAGSDEAQICSLAEDLSLCRDPYDPWPLVEEVKSFPDDESADALAAHASARLRAVGTPMMQVQCSVHLGDPAGISPGDVWPGQLVDLVTEGFPSLPDGKYRMRLMQMDGDETDDCTLTFDVTADPAYA